jgi:DNA-binding transcriptional MocR family regulator
LSPVPEAAAAVREMIAAGTLKPGDPAPCGRELAAGTGLPLTACQAALRSLKADGTLERAAFPARLQVAQPGRAPSPEDEELGRALVRLRKARRLTRQHLAVLLGVPAAAVEQAEAGRGGRNRDFWQRADGMLGAEGALLYEHDTRTA